MKRILCYIFTIMIIFIPSISSEPLSTANLVALTFDDGPSKYTSKIIDLLNEYNCHATFFVIGNKASVNQETLSKIIDNGNEIANHTYTHPWLTHLNVNNIAEEIEKTNKIIYSITGIKPKLFRPSYGDINQNTRRKINMQIVMWTNDSNDWKYKNYKTIASRVIKNIKNNDIILMHDTYERSYKALKIIIPKLQNQGYNFVTFSDLYEYRKMSKIDGY